MTWKEVYDHVKEFVDSMERRTGEDDPPPTCDSGFWCIVRDYEWCRDNLRHGVLKGGPNCGHDFDTLEGLAEYVVLKYAIIAQTLIEWTPLRQEDDLRLAVDLMIEQGDERHRKREKEEREQELVEYHQRREDRKRFRQNQNSLGLYN